MEPGQIVFTPQVNNVRLVLTVAGPNEYFDRQEIENGSISLSMIALKDGAYSYELRAEPIVPAEVQKALAQARESGDYSVVTKLRSEGKLPEEALVQSGSFRINGGSLVLPSGETGKPVSDRDEGTTKDQVILDDLIVDGSACVGMDCVNGESFGFDTIRLKENNLRIKFQDTSNSASFPTNDWQITANDSENGGANKFSIDDIDGGRTPFTIEASAPSHSLYVDDGGRIGMGTSTPVVQLHVKDGNTPTLRLEQDGSSGFTPQTWDVSGNEANFFIRDATNGSTLPFRIRPGAQTSSIDIEADDDINFINGKIYFKSDGRMGIGTSDPSGNFEIQSDSPIFMTMNNTSQASWSFNSSNNGTFRISDYDAVNNIELTLAQNGDLTISGALTTAGGSYPDYVFEPEYDLMTLGELESFITENGHLPNVPTSEDVDGGKRINMTELQIKMLEKIEELTLYTLAQQKRIEALEGQLAAK
jgi:hypothetical protein